MCVSSDVFTTDDPRIINVKLSSNVMNISVSLNRFVDFPFRQSLMLIRPFHIVHQLAIVILVLSLKSLSPPWFVVFKAWLMLFLLMPFLFGLNDLMHRMEDRQMGRDRLFTSDSISMWMVSMFLFFVLLMMSLLALESGIFTFIFLVLMIVCGLAYGYFKHKRQMVRTYLFRLLSGMSFYLVVAVYFGFSLSDDVRVSLIVGVLDLFSHVAGDLRDYPLDVEGGVRTFPVVYGIESTERLILALELFGLLLVILVFGFGISFWSVVLFGSGLGWLLYFLLKESGAYSWQHGSFHGQKVFIYVLISHFSGFSEWFVPLFLFGWFMSYCLYLWADDRLSGSSGFLFHLMSNPLGL